METPKEKVIQLINKELEENYELINDEKNYYHDDIQAVKIQTNFLAKMLLEVEEITDPTVQLKADKAELLEMLEIFIEQNTPTFTSHDYEFPEYVMKAKSLIQKHKR